MSTIRSLWQKLFLMLLPALFAGVVAADETEILQDNTSQVNANVLFLLDMSGSMRWELDAASGRTRVDVLKESFQKVMDTAPPNIRVGLAYYGDNHVYSDQYGWRSEKGIVFPVSNLDASVQDIIGPHAAGDNLPDPPAQTSVSDFLQTIVNGWEPAGYTPIVDSLYEAARYFRGENLDWGHHLPVYEYAAHPSTYEGTVSCSSSSKVECLLSQDRCNETVDMSNAYTQTYNTCCGGWQWDDVLSQWQCPTSDYSCTIDYQYAHHTICNQYDTPAPEYKTPIEEACQANYLVVMSDGKPEYPYWPSKGEVDGTHYYPPSIDNAKNMMGTGCASSPQGYNSGECGPEITQFLATQDQNLDMDGKQTVETFSIAFGLANEPRGGAYLESLATVEDGFFAADSAEALQSALSNILRKASDNSYAFSSPSYAVNEDSLLSHSDEVFVPVFDKTNKAKWKGNLRKFKLKNGKLVGKDGRQVMLRNGTLRDTAWDFWSDAPSGKLVDKGGAAGKLPTWQTRNVLTDAGGSIKELAVDNTAIQPEDFSEESVTYSEHGLYDTLVTERVRKKINCDKATDQNGDGQLDETELDPGHETHLHHCEDDMDRHDWLGGNDGFYYGYKVLGTGQDGWSSWGWYYDCSGNYVKVRPWTTGIVNIEEVTTCPTQTVVTSQERKELIEFARGKKKGEDGERLEMGDMLNTKPIIINYGNAGKQVIVATNEGYLHAFDTETGVEQWAFMPVELLKNLGMLYSDVATDQHAYGLDGDITLWKRDVNKDGHYNESDGDFIYMYFGMRRGGSMYYALNLTEKNNPRLLWSLSPDVQGFEELGQTWSKLTRATMRVGSTTDNELVDVMVFGGGYDLAKDESIMDERAPDSKGRNVYIVNAKTGELIWSLRDDVYGAKGLLKDSIPGDIRVLDMDRNGSLDRLYFADTGGSVWRVDMDADIRDGDDSLYNYKDAKLTRFAKLDTANDDRQFFHEPDVAMMMYQGKPIMTIAIGSGYHAHPLDKQTKDRFYVLRDMNPYEALPSSFRTIKNSDLVNVNTLSGQSILETDHKGWFLPLAASRGEKVLASALTFMNKVVFTSFVSAVKTEDVCDVENHQARAYAMDLFTGNAVADLRRNGGANDRFVVAGVNEILDAPQLVFRTPEGASGQCAIGDCQQTVEIRVGKSSLPLIDESNTSNNSVAESADMTHLFPTLYWLNADTSVDENN